MLHLLCPLVVCGECPESGSSGLGVATSIQHFDLKQFGASESACLCMEVYMKFLYGQ